MKVGTVMCIFHFLRMLLWSFFLCPCSTGPNPAFQHKWSIQRPVNWVEPSFPICQFTCGGSSTLDGTREGGHWRIPARSQRCRGCDSHRLGCITAQWRRSGDIQVGLGQQLYLPFRCLMVSPSLPLYLSVYLGCVFCCWCLCSDPSNPKLCNFFTDLVQLNIISLTSDPFVQSVGINLLDSFWCIVYVVFIFYFSKLKCQI